MTGGHDRVSVVVVNFRSSHVIERLLDSLGDADETILVDNFSSDEERTAIRALAVRRSAVFVPRGNDGFAGGVNAGARAAAPRNRLLIANPDAYFEPGALRTLVAAAGDAGTDVTAPVILRSGTGSVWFAGGTVDPRTMEVVHHGFGRPRPRRSGHTPTTFVSGCVMLLSPRARAELLPLREDLFMYYEDVELCLRARERGLTLAVADDAVAYHDEGLSSGGRGSGRSPLYYYYQARNRPLLVQRWSADAAFARRVATYRVAARALARILVRERTGRRAKATAVLRGTRDGARALSRVSTGPAAVPVNTAHQGEYR